MDEVSQTRGTAQSVRPGMQVPVDCSSHVPGSSLTARPSSLTRCVPEQVSRAVFEALRSFAVVAYTMVPCG